MYRDRDTITKYKECTGTDIPLKKDKECIWTDTFTGKECTGTDKPLQRTNFNLVNRHTDTHTDRVTFALLELLLRS